METKKINNKVITMARLSTVIELVLGILACFILPLPFLIGFFLGIGGAISCVAIGHFYIRRSSPVWRGQFWEGYCISIAQRQPTISALIIDNWALLALLAYALFVPGAVIACGLLGIAAAISSIILVQSFVRSGSPEGL